MLSLRRLCHPILSTGGGGAAAAAGKRVFLKFPPWCRSIVFFWQQQRRESLVFFHNFACSAFPARVRTSARCLQTSVFDQQHHDSVFRLKRDRSWEDYADINWDNLGFGLVPADYMYVMKCSDDENFTEGRLDRYKNIELSPSSGVLNYAQGLFEGLKAYRKADGRGLILFRPHENAMRLQEGAKRMCMPSPSVDQFVHAIKETMLANKRWVPPPGKGALYIRPLLIGTGPVLGLAPAPEYTFLTYASPVGNYFKEGLAPLNLFVEDYMHRATPGGTGGVKTISNYAPVLKAQLKAKSQGFTDVLFLDSVEKRYLEEAASCNVFVVKGNIISTPALKGTVLPGITRKSIIQLARGFGYQVEERQVPVDELLDADEVFCTGTAVVVAHVGSITHKQQRIEYETGETTIARKLYVMLTGIQNGHLEDKMGWTVVID